jgi:hypothetical protein
MVEDTAWGLAILGTRAALRRFDVRWPLKLLFIAWFLAMAMAPRPLAQRLAGVWYFPGRRGPVNRMLRAFHVSARTWARSAAGA